MYFFDMIPGETLTRPDFLKPLLEAHRQYEGRPNFSHTGPLLMRDDIHKHLHKSSNSNPQNVMEMKYGRHWLKKMA